MKEIMCIETNETDIQIKKIKEFIKNFYFDGGYVFYLIKNKDFSKIKGILGKEIL